MYPKPDRSDQTRNFVKTEENEDLDIGWNEGFLSDGRPYRVECWAEGQLTLLTFFFSTVGKEDYSDSMLQDLLCSEGLVQFVSDEPNVSAMPATDASGNNMWSVNLVIGTEDDLLVKSFVNLREYEGSKVILRPEIWKRQTGDPMASVEARTPADSGCQVKKCEKQEVTLRERRSPDGELSSLKAHIDGNGDLVLEGYDAGDRLEAELGISDYEYWRRVKAEHVPTVLLQLIKDRFSRDGEFHDWLESKGIPDEFDNWM